jgi:hypothetical protein
MVTAQTEYTIRPPFKTKFRSAEARPLIEQIISDCLARSNQATMAHEIAEKTKDALKGLKKDSHYKFMVQVTLGNNNGQGVRCGSRHYWDEDTDDVCHVSMVTDKKFVLVIAYAIYMY